MRRMQQSSRTVLYSDGSETKDCQELPLIRLVDPDNGVVSLELREKHSTKRKHSEYRHSVQKKKYVKNGIKIINSRMYISDI